jgi:hypothetical protein
MGNPPRDGDVQGSVARPVEVDIAVRRDKEMQAHAGMIKQPVAVINLPVPVFLGSHGTKVHF